ncbi:hypothetical protein OHA77_11680 [Streptosporangium sp. NBC_01639]|uniref:hypothetical protein n=1 Tax=Streptosporangium sp. NBC_01639 TaxID=2975948 RepID=UPI00386F4430|nr:hypothetical protein OHA77_11680 [Streptosporangium sp. NBC_01639]
MTAGLDSFGFGVLGVPRPPDTNELERQAGVLEAAVSSRRSLDDDGARAHRLGAGNAGIANDALDEHVAGKAGLLSRSTDHTQHASVAASVSQVATTVVKWAGGLIAGLAGLAGLAAFTPQGRVMLLRLRPFAHRVQGWIRAAMQSVGRLFTRLADLVRGTTAKGRVGRELEAKRRQMSAQWRRAAPTRAATVRARISTGQATQKLNRAEEQLRRIESSLLDARNAVHARVDAAYARGEIDAAARARLKAGHEGWANHPWLDDLTRSHLSQQATRLEQLEARLGGRHTTGHLNDAQRHVNEGLDLAKTNGANTSDLYKLQSEVSELASRRYELADQAWTTRMNINGPFKIQDVYPV